MHAWVYVSAHRSQRRAPGPPRTRVAEGCELPCGCWESSSGPRSARWSRALSGRAVSPVPLFFLRVVCVFSICALSISAVPISRSLPSFSFYSLQLLTFLGEVLITVTVAFFCFILLTKSVVDVHFSVTPCCELSWLLSRISGHHLFKHPSDPGLLLPHFILLLVC